MPCGVRLFSYVHDLYISIVGMYIHIYKKCIYKRRKYTPEELAGVARTEARTYVAVKPTTTNARSMSIMSNGNKISGYKISE